MPTSTSNGHLDVLVIGAGQAGLAIGYHLAQRRLNFLIVDAGPAVGHVWRNRWDSLRLFTPAEYDALPGTPFSRSGRQPPDQGRSGRLPQLLRALSIGEFMTGS